MLAANIRLHGDKSHGAQVGPLGLAKRCGQRLAGDTDSDMGLEPHHADGEDKRARLHVTNDLVRVNVLSGMALNDSKTDTRANGTSKRQASC